MTALQLYALLLSRGFVVRIIAPGRLGVSPGSELTAEEIEWVALWKTALLCLAEGIYPPDVPDAFRNPPAAGVRG